MERYLLPYLFLLFLGPTVQGEVHCACFEILCGVPLRELQGTG